MTPAEHAAAARGGRGQRPAARRGGPPPAVLEAGRRRPGRVQPGRHPARRPGGEERALRPRGHRDPQDSYEFGAPPGRSNGSYRFMDASGDGRTVIYGLSSGPGGPLAPDPQAWRNELCRVIGYRTLTDDERAGLPTRLPADPPYAASDRPTGG